MLLQLVYLLLLVLDGATADPADVALCRCSRRLLVIIELTFFVTAEPRPPRLPLPTWPLAGSHAILRCLVLHVSPSGALLSMAPSLIPTSLRPVGRKGLLPGFGRIAGKKRQLLSLRRLGPLGLLRGLFWRRGRGWPWRLWWLCSFRGRRRRLLNSCALSFQTFLWLLWPARNLCLLWL